MLSKDQLKVLLIDMDTDTLEQPTLVSDAENQSSGICVCQ